MVISVAVSEYRNQVSMNGYCTVSYWLDNQINMSTAVLQVIGDKTFLWRSVSYIYCAKFMRKYLNFNTF